LERQEMLERQEKEKMELTSLQTKVTKVGWERWRQAPRSDTAIFECGRGRLGRLPPLFRNKNALTSSPLFT